MAGLTTQIISGAPLTKEDFISRVQRRAARYDQTFSEAGLNDLIKDRLVSKPTRSGNAGQRPIYTYDFRIYRRVLQILRIRQRGIVGRDGQRIALFLERRIGVDNDLRLAISREYNKAAKALRSKMRSSYPENSRAIPAKHKQKLIESFGDLHPMFEQASLQLSEEQCIGAIRQAKATMNSTDVISDMGKSIAKGAHIDANSMMPLFSGMLLLDGDENDPSKSLDSVDNLIKYSEDVHFLAAQGMIRVIDSRAAAAAAQMFFPNTTPDAYRDASRFVAAAARHDPAIATLIIVSCLKLLASTNGNQILRAIELLSDSK